ncbi:hypothetical protein KY284_033187 [Solanum tuberosum]|nr:hypothetical protein KY284_033187 [Solanum tuberosum]
MSYDPLGPWLLHKESSCKVPANKYVIQVKWEPPVPGSFKLNTDGAVKESPRPGSLGSVIRNHRGDWIIGSYQQRSPCQPNPGKVCALREGVLMAIKYKLNPIDINTDSMELINMFEHDNHLFTDLIFECRLLMEKLGAAMPTHIFREQNKVSDKKEGL